MQTGRDHRAPLLHRTLGRAALGQPAERLLASRQPSTDDLSRPPAGGLCATWQQLLLSLGQGPGSVPLGLTLIEAQKYARRAEQLAVLKTFAEGELLRRLPFRNLVGGSLSFPAETKLPRVGFRAVNEGYRQSYGVINSDSEFVHLFGGDLDVDRSIVDLQGPEARAAQTEMKVRSMRLTLEAAIINGDDTFDPRAFNGLSKRLVPGEDQTIDNGGSTLNLLALEALTDSVIGYGGDKVLIASKAARRQISTASRQAGGDLYEVIDGRHYFEGIEILLVEEDAEGNPVLGYDEPGDTTSIYCCVLGDAAVCGLQGPFEGRYGISVRDFGEVHDAPVFRTRVDWYVGFAVCNRKAAARLFNVAPMPLVLP